MDKLTTHCFGNSLERVVELQVIVFNRCGEVADEPHVSVVTQGRSVTCQECQVMFFPEKTVSSVLTARELRAYCRQYGHFDPVPRNFRIAG